MKVCKGCKRDDHLRFTFDGDPLCKFCAPIAAHVVQVLENDHDPVRPLRMCCSACESMRDCGCGTCVGDLRSRITEIFGEVPDRIEKLIATALRSAA